MRAATTSRPRRRIAGFALAYVGLANTSGTNREFVEAVTKAVGLAAKVSDGERHMVLALDAGLKNDPAAVLRHYTELVALFPNDERAQTLLANTYFGRQEYQRAIDHFVKATDDQRGVLAAVQPDGYAYRFLGKNGEAEAAFKKYIELIPDDPNPYDSYAELLMKMGRFDESIAMYNKALAIDANFVASYIGIGNDQLFKGQPAAARETFAKIAKVARNTGERRTAHFWTAASYVHEGATDKALAELEANVALSGSGAGWRVAVRRSDADGRHPARGRTDRRGAREVRRRRSRSARRRACRPRPRPRRGATISSSRRGRPWPSTISSPPRPRRRRTAPRWRRARCRSRCVSSTRSKG